MKKLSALLALSTLSGSIVFAQRTVDLSATMTSPVNGSNITAGEPFQIDVSVKNVGPNPLKATDTVLIGYYVDDPSNLLRDDSNNLITTYFTGQILATNETSTTSLTLTSSDAVTGSHEFCAIAVPINGSADSLNDIDLDNNVSCSSVEFVTSPTSVRGTTATPSKHMVSGPYPNPANGYVNFDLQMSERDAVKIVINDIVGRTVIEENKGILTAGQHKLKVTADHLPAGTYIYYLSIGEDRVKGKFSLNKN